MNEEQTLAIMAAIIIGPMIQANRPDPLTESATVALALRTKVFDVVREYGNKNVFK